MKEVYLFQLSKELKLFLTLFLLVLTIGISVGLLFLYHTTSFSKDITTERLIEDSNNIDSDFGIDESNSRSTGELLMTTHNHIIGFSFILFFVGGIFYFNSIVTGFWKSFFLIEPLISTIISFGSMWAVRYSGEFFIYLTIASAVLMYVSIFFMIIISLIDLNLKKHA